MSVKAILLEQFTASYEENGWFVALKNAIDGVTPAQSVWKIDGLDHSIRESVIHLTYWNERWLKRYRGETLEANKAEISETFLNDREPDWEAEKARLFEVMDAWTRELENISEEKLNERVSATYEAPWYMPLAHQNIHNAYHISQIVVARKLQKAWDNSKGVS
jgi:uncharacterized damage-inducible protein DinB